MSWMMLPRAGGRDFKETHKIITQIYERNIAAWEQDSRTFTAVKPRKKSSKPAAKKKATKKKR